MSKNAKVALDCGSRSISRVFFFFRASAAARLMEVVVLPTPPFWLAIAMTQVKLCPSLFPRLATIGLYVAAPGPSPTTSRPTVPT